MRAHAPLFSSLLSQRFEPPLQHSAVNTPPSSQLLALPLQGDVIPLHLLDACDPTPILYVLLQGRGETPLLPSAIYGYVPLLYSLLLWKGVPLRHPSADTAPLPLISDLLPQQVKPLHQPSTVNHPPLPKPSALPIAVSTPLPQISALPLQQVVPYLLASSRACSSYALYLASRAMHTPSFNFSHACLCYSALVVGSDVCVS